MNRIAERMRTATVVAPGRFEVRERPVPRPGKGEVLIRVRACGICGTDVHIFRGRYMGTYPVIPGHELAGDVAAVGAGVRRIDLGDRVAVEPNIACDDCSACLSNRQNFCENWQALGVTLPGGMAQYVVAPESAVFPIGDIPFEHGAFVEPLSCVLHGVEQAGIALGDHVAVLGAGPIGILLMRTMLARGAAAVDMAERVPDRAAFARRAGADKVVGDVADLPEDAYDAVVDATGAVPVMERAPALARRGGTVLLFGVPPVDQTMAQDPFMLFHKGLTLLSSFTSLRNSLQAVALLRAGRVRVDDLISHRIPLEELERGIGLIESGKEGVMKVMVRPNGP